MLISVDGLICQIHMLSAIAEARHSRLLSGEGAVHCTLQLCCAYLCLVAA
jgi:hypothetical protein